MFRIIWLLLAVSMFTFPSLSIAALGAPARIKLADGDILFRTPDSGEWLPATVNTPLDEGDTVWCPPGGRIELQLADGTIVRLNGGSQLDLLANEDDFTHLHLASGSLYLRTIQNMSPDSLQIDADDTTVLPAARTRLRIDMLDNSQEDVAIFRGSAYVEAGGSRTKVRAGEQIALEDGRQDLLPLNPPDQWEKWNTARDRLQSRSATIASNLPDELRSYSSELDSSGRWERVPEYGMVWRPTVILADDWAPYRSGRWIWKGDDYVWISFESWGWVPYHFGRWAVVAGLGWCWVPPARGDVYWGPGYVGWHRTGSHIGWTPLAPGEPFYGRRYYGRNSVNITTTRVAPDRIVYRNRDLRGGLTIVQQNDFLRGRIPAQRPVRASELSVSVSIGSPRLQPLRETRMPIVKQTPPRIAPPRIEHTDSRDLRARFPRVAPARELPARRQPASSGVVPPPAPAVKPPPAREHREMQPTAPAPSAPTRPDAQPQAQPPQRDHSRQNPPAPQTYPPVTAPQQPQQPQQRNQPSRVTSPPVNPVDPAAGLPRTGRRPGAAAPAVVTSPATPAMRGDQPKREQKARDVKQKKVWKVTTPEQAIEKGSKDTKDKEPRRERRER